MSLEVREEISAVIFYKDVGSLDTKESVAIAPAFQAVSSAVSPDSINVDIEGIHSVVTRNFTYYSPECLKKSAPYWTSPYEKPVIMHHKDKDGIQIGRVKNAEYLEQTKPGMPGLLFTVNIGDEAGIKGVKNGTLSTVSIGAIIHKATCSICGQNIASEGECEHKRGRHYDGKLCYWIMNDMEPKELSYVIVPSDKYANTIKIYEPHKQAIKERHHGVGIKFPIIRCGIGIRNRFKVGNDRIVFQQRRGSFFFRWIAKLHKQRTRYPFQSGFYSFFRVFG